MKHIILLLLSLLGFATPHLVAQSKVDLTYVDLKSDVDKDKYEKNFVEAVKLLENTAIGKDKTKREKLKAFVIVWITNSPTVTFTAGQDILDLTEKNPELLVVYMASYSKSLIENRPSANVEKPVRDALQSLLKLYTAGTEMKKVKVLEKMLNDNAEKERHIEKLVAEQNKKE